MLEGEHDVAVRELSLFSDQLVIDRVRVNMVEASLLVTSTCLDKSTMECVELYRLLAEA